ncbi:MAG TPA: hypothetical protein VJT71_07065 [Pyrinomonadaceae bacterium]|nr:hypothetical protein [Pyrinomonadaceae bacterium]
MILAISSTLLVAAAYKASGTTTIAPKVLQAKLLRRHAKLKERLSAEDLAWLRSHGQEKEERLLEDKLPKHLPIKVRIKGEKEKALKEIENDHWIRDFELEVKNTGTRTIYYLVLILGMPELKFGQGNMVFDLRFGDKKFMNFASGAKPEDVSLRPGESCFLKLNPAVDWREHSRDMPHWPKPKRLILQFQEINFGDGPGFRTTDGIPWPPPDRKSESAACLQNAGSDTPPWKAHYAVATPTRGKFSFFIRR